ncbi:MAG: trypsin-like serine protease [Bacteroidetes bacterium]|nr:trypsin-like serine protease [Bacteroidota bacterium]
MEKNIHNQEIIDRYLRDELSKTELVEFNKKMFANAEFASEVKEQQELIESLNQYVKVKKIKKQLQKSHLELDQPYPLMASRFKRNVRNLVFTSSVAATIALAAVFGSLYFAGWFDYNKNVSSYYELKKDIENLSSTQQSIWKALFTTEKKTVIKYSGTGFLISSQGYLVTNYHLVKNSDTIFITNNTDSLIKFSAKVVYKSRKADIAILKAICDSAYSFGPIPFVISQSDVTLGQDVFTLGFSKEDVVFGQGTINSLSGFKSDTIAYETSVPANPGNSGAPLLDEQGNIVGIISGRHSKNVSSTFAVKAKYLQCLINEMAADSTLEQIILPSTSSIKWLDKTDKVKKLQPYIFKVEVYQ